MIRVQNLYFYTWNLKKKWNLDENLFYPLNVTFIFNNYTLCLGYLIHICVLCASCASLSLQISHKSYGPVTIIDATLNSRIKKRPSKNNKKDTKGKNLKSNSSQFHRLTNQLKFVETVFPFAARPNVYVSKSSVTTCRIVGSFASPVRGKNFPLVIGSSQRDGINRS